MDRFQAALEADGFECLRYARFVNWSQALNGASFEAYMAGRPGRLRNTVARKSRKLQREHGYKIRLYTNEGLPEALEAFQTVFRASWKGTETDADLIPGLAPRLAARGWLRLAVLTIAGHPAAAQLWFVAHGKASIFRLAYDEAWKRYSPGSILTRYLVKHVIEVDRVDFIDFLVGDDPYKKEWVSQSRDRWVLACACEGKRGGLMGRLERLLKRMFER